MNGKAIMFQGTGSDVGKSLIVAGLARALANRGYAVRPFKPQNMSNNAAVTYDGGEIGRAQALQAKAARTPPLTDMNPVLLKPQSELGAQVIVQGKVIGNQKAREFQRTKPKLMNAVLESFERLKAHADFVLVEGAGSASEINLRLHDLANMGFARAANVPVVVIGDIDRGGVIAALVGTKTVIAPEDASMVCGFIVNRFRGDPALFDKGMKLIAQKTGWQDFGLIPHFKNAFKLPAEDGFKLEEKQQQNGTANVKIAVPILPHIANFDDLDPLIAEPDVSAQKIWPGEVIQSDTDLIILCGSKSTIADLATLHAEGWDVDIKAHMRRGGSVLGICGGYQMLGNYIADPEGVEGSAQTVKGLSLLDVQTVLGPQKHLEQISGHSFDGTPFEGYEMHMGEMSGTGLQTPFATLQNGQAEGALSPNGRICGTYIHGLFANDKQRSSWLKRLGGKPSNLDHERQINEVLDALANHLETHMDIEAIIQMAR